MIEKQQYISTETKLICKLHVIRNITDDISQLKKYLFNEILHHKNGTHWSLEPSSKNFIKLWSELLKIFCLQETISQRCTLLGMQPT